MLSRQERQRAVSGIAGRRVVRRAFNNGVQRAKAQGLTGFSANEMGFAQALRALDFVTKQQRRNLRHA